jgi:hypothetical protein
MGDYVESAECRRECGQLRLEEICATSADCPALRYSDGTKPGICYAPDASAIHPPWIKHCLLP